jgi:hypothetical protein
MVLNFFFKFLNKNPKCGPIQLTYVLKSFANWDSRQAKKVVKILISLQ